MAKVEVIISTVRYGSNGFKHKGDTYSLPDNIAKEKEAQGLVKILSLDSDKVVKLKVEKVKRVTKELKEVIKAK